MREVNARKILVDILFYKQEGLCATCQGQLKNKRRKGLQYIRLDSEPLDTESNVHLVHVYCLSVTRKNDRALQTERLAQDGKKAREIAEELKISQRSVYRYLKTANIPRW